MNGADNFSPSINLGLRVDHGEVRRASGVGCDEGAFRDEECSRRGRALFVVFDRGIFID